MAKLDKKPEIRNTPHGPVYVLKGGRTIAVPPAGGKVSRAKIRAAVSEVVSARKKLKVG